MTQQERQQLNQIVEKLKEAQEVAPDVVRYSQGRVGANVSYQLLGIIGELEEMLGEQEAAQVVNEPDS